MKIDAIAKQIIRIELEEALQCYDDYKKGYTIPDKLVPYIDMLDEVDEIKSYVYDKITHKTKDEHNALKLFLSGKRFNDIVNIMRESEINFDEVYGWFYGNKEKEGFIPHLFDKFLMLNSYCPFCDSTRMQSNSPGYPLNAKVCPHKEIEWSEEE